MASPALNESSLIGAAADVTAALLSASGKTARAGRLALTVSSRGQNLRQARTRPLMQRRIGKSLSQRPRASSIVSLLRSQFMTCRARSSTMVSRVRVSGFSLAEAIAT